MWLHAEFPWLKRLAAVTDVSHAPAGIIFTAIYIDTPRPVDPDSMTAVVFAWLVCRPSGARCRGR